MKGRRKVIIDCDPGIDDSLALILALSLQELEVVGITVVSGNVSAKQGVQNALKSLEIMDALHVPVYLGEENPLSKKLATAQDTHGEDGIGECFFEKVEGVDYKKGAVNFIIQTLNKKENVSIIALGPLTNIAKALMKDKEAFKNLDEFVSMGGSFRSYGNCSPVAEFNYWVDPHAADYVYKNLGKPIHMVGLDVTRKIVLTPNIIELIRRLGGDLAQYIIDITRFYMDFHWNQEGIIGCVINDPLAVAYFIDRSICCGFSSYVEVVCEGISIGQSIVDVENFWQKPHNAIILNKVDSIKFMNMFLKRLFPKKGTIIDKVGGVIIDEK
ncbi:nucleoside hydrolase [Clostridium sp. MB40-C1]|uniref:nucleoside hydrolase n=1 Tax=Clostridium sp. MB40-C1 TaxID=3070996 RepID=UPI0027E1C0BA|nr:nucleoside hydrolase [Clostridium sp. MB40-C1]WMJ79262.1 nucleoside hydrolase [Clostridium sp. MB40-C1]